MNDEFFLEDGKEVVVTSHMNVRCDGGNGPLGHPAEFLTLSSKGQAVCGYCGRRYVLEGTPAATAVRATGQTKAA
ncbi:zinc-finger domain-containing protein [Arboricoccus pini]|nr:zinc-finger domain-containing protein [Arboricoccus pini]